MTTAAIRFLNVTKSYRLAHQRPFLAKELLLRVAGKFDGVKSHEALRDISFEVQPGGSLGVVGSNGSGKSTLLSLVAGISYATSGTVEVNGRVGPLLELGAGFHPELTGFENIYLNASLLGMSREEVDLNIASIVDYSGIRDFIDTPINKYSTGMVARLGFSVIAHLKPDILLVDETLAVGDAEFNIKCQATFREFLDRGTTLLVVSHDLDMVEQLCQHVMWIEKGEIRELGEASEVLDLYRSHSG